jgi:hypothetical protein
VFVIMLLVAMLKPPRHQCVFVHRKTQSGILNMRVISVRSTQRGSYEAWSILLGSLSLSLSCYHRISLIRCTRSVQKHKTKKEVQLCTISSLQAIGKRAQKKLCNAYYTHCLILHTEASRNYKVSVQIVDRFFCIISTSEQSNCPI